MRSMTQQTPRPPRRTNYNVRRKKKPAAFAALALLGLLVVWPLRALFAKGTTRRKVALGVCAAVGVVLVFLVADWALYSGDIHRGVHVYGVNVGGMAPDEAAAKVAETGAKDGTVALTYKGKSWTLSTAELKARLDGKAAAHDAYWYTREGNLFTRGWRRVRLWIVGSDLDPPVAFNQNAVTEAVNTIARRVEVKPVAATVVMHGTVPLVKGARDGVKVDRDAVDLLLSRAALSGETVTSDVPTRKVAPAVSTAEAKVAAEQARSFLGGPLTLKYKDHEFTIDQGELGQYLAFVAQKDGPKLKATFHSPVTNGYFDYITSQIGKPGKDASFVEIAGGKRVKVVPGSIGHGVVEAPTVANMEAAALKEGDQRVAQIVFGKAKPALSYAEAKQLGITTRVGTYTTGVSGTANRLNNVRLGAEMLDDTMIPPGGIFSVNATTGERTAAAGFKMAPTIINGKLEDTIGGGMCQISTTVFNAALGAGVEIVERHNHQLYISHYPLGRDAAVSYGSNDLKFRNDTKNWMLLKTTFSGWSLNVSLYSAPLHRKVVITTGQWYDVTPYKKERKPDPTLPAGTLSVETPGVSGESIDCFYKVYEAGKLIHDQVFKSVYMMVPEVVLVGTKAKTPSPSPSPSPSGTKKPSPSPSPSH